MDCGSCSLPTGESYDYIVTEIVLPTSAAEAAAIGVDIDGDGDIDNRLHEILIAVPLPEDPNRALAEDIWNGSLILLGRLVLRQFPTSDVAFFQLFPGATDTGDPTEDNLTGTGTAFIDPEADRDLHLCAFIAQGHLGAGPSHIAVSFPFGDLVVDTYLDRAQAVSEGTVDASRWNDVMIGGGFTVQTLEEELFPTVVDWLNAEVRENASSPVGQFALHSVDCRCAAAVVGCENVINEQGDCACWGGTGDPTDPVSVTEFKCNFALSDAFAPDVDIDGDRVPDLLPVGVKVQAVSVNIGN
jgi:hypothetical protein